MITPTIIVVTYNRPSSLLRILSSLSHAAYPYDSNINLVISIDYVESDNHREVVTIANNFKWSFGNKIIIEHNQNLGLRKHILSCGDMSEKYGSIIVLEDDLYVSPHFYSYVIDSQNFYRKDFKIGGISLYNHKMNFNCRLPFELIPAQSDVYFLQIASSWGQSWTFDQWKLFRNWYKDVSDENNFENISDYINGWPKSSWLKFYIAYLVETDRYFVYPKVSLTTNFSDAGTHNKIKNTDYQVPLLLDQKIFSFESLKTSINVYDSFFELSPNIIKKYVSHLKDKDFTVDMYGVKKLSMIKTKYLLSSKEYTYVKKNKNTCKYGIEVKPMIMNVLLNIEGEFFTFSETKFFSEIKKINIIKVNTLNYFFLKIDFEKLLKIVLNKILNKTNL